MGKITLLVVDDIEMNRKIVGKIFECDNNVDIFEAANGKEAMQLIESTHIDILITDIFMEPMNGYELIKNIRSRKEYKKIPIIAITESDQASRKKALKAGADDLIYRPFISTILQNRVKGLIFDGIDINRYKLAYENNPMPYVLYHIIDRPDTPNYKILYLNKAARESVSPPYIEDVSQTDEDIELRDFLLSALRSGEPKRHTLFVKEINRWLDWTIYPDGTGLVAAMINDITSEIEKQTEESNKNAKEAIAQRNSIFEVVENIPGGIFVFQLVEDDIIIINANSSGCRLLDVDPVNILGVHKDKILSFVYKDDIEVVLSAMKELIIPETETSYRCRIFNRSKNKYVWFSAQGHSKLQDDGSIYVFINYVDITLERELLSTKAELLAVKKANIAKTQFLSRVSHDMRTPLNGILGITALLKKKIKEEDALQDLEQLEMSGQYLLNLITDTLDVSRIESGKLQLHLEVCQGRKVLNNIIALMKPNLQEKNINFSIKTDNLPYTYLYLDIGRVEQIVMNVLGNAIKFTPVGGVIELIMENVSVSETVIVDKLIIRDHGIGMSKEFLPHLFEPFSQEDNSTTTSSSGTGLGLTIVKQIVELMGGSINVESELGKGTTFEFIIPLLVASKEQIKQFKEVKQITYNYVSLKEKRVLLCEDHPLNATIARRLLEEKGMIVEHAKNGQEGLRMFNESSISYYDIILMDIRMPIMDGLQTTKEIRKLVRQDAITVPIIAMTANAFDSDIKNSIEVGMNGHLSKPIDINKLYQTIEQMIH